MSAGNRGEGLNQRLISKQKDLISRLEDRIRELERERESLIESAESMVKEFSSRLGDLEAERNRAVLKLRAFQEYMVKK